jgi:aspartyl-tRNA(Asn)/glutamyl-tRNA(Gln) amidotransferase subunit A
VLSGEEFTAPEPIALAGLRFGVAQGLPLESLDETVAATFAAALKSLGAAGVRLTDDTLPLLDEMREVNAYGGIVQPEACAIHRDRLKRRSADIDPNVRVRLERGGTVSATDYVDMMQARTRLVRAMDRRLAALDVLVMPTTPIVAPTMAEVTDAKDYAVRNALVLRNTSVGNFFDLSGISLPLKAKLPVGLMLMARNGHDHMLLRIAAAVEKALAS